MPGIIVVVVSVLLGALLLLLRRLLKQEIIPHDGRVQKYLQQMHLLVGLLLSLSLSLHGTRYAGATTCQTETLPLVPPSRNHRLFLSVSRSRPSREDHLWPVAQPARWVCSFP